MNNNDEFNIKTSMWNFRSNYMNYYYNHIDNHGENEQENIETMKKRQEMELHLMKLWHQRQLENINKKKQNPKIQKTSKNEYNFLRNRCKNLSKKNHKKSSSQDCNHHHHHYLNHNNNINIDFDPLDIKANHKLSVHLPFNKTFTIINLLHLKNYQNDKKIIT